MSKALEQQEIEKEKIERVIFFLRDLYLLTKDGYTTVKWTVLSDKYLTSPLVKQVLLARGTITKAATKNLYYWSSKSIPSWDMAESIYQSAQALIQKEKTNKQIVDSFKKKTEGKLIPVVKMPQTISEVFGLSKDENPVKTKLSKFSDERRIEAIKKILYFCRDIETARSSTELTVKLREVTCGAPTLQWLKLKGWLQNEERGRWRNPTSMDPAMFNSFYLNQLKIDLRKDKSLAKQKDLDPNNFEKETLAFVRGLDPEKWYSMSSLFVYMSRAKVPVHVREAIIDQRFENNKGKFRLNESKAILPANTTVKEKHEEIAKGNKSIVENLKQQRIEFAKMLFKLGDVKAANEILTKELE